MFQHLKNMSKRLVLAGYSLVEVSFVLMMVGVIIVPVLLNQTAQQELLTNQPTPIENANLTSTELISLLTNSPHKRTELVKEISEQMVELAQGSKIVDKNMSARDELFSGAYLDNTATFFEDTDPSANVNYEYILPSAPEGVIKTSQKTFFLTTSDGKYVPLFTYQWEFRDQSSNTDDDKQNTSTGTYLVRGELKVFEIATPTAEDDKTTPVTQAPPWTRSLTSNFNVRNTPLVEEIKGNTPRVLLNFTFDMSRGACYSPATSQYSRRLTHNTAIGTQLSLISYDSGTGLLCAPYFQPSTYNPPNAGDSTPWAYGEVQVGSGGWRPDWYDIYYNGPSGLFWTNGLLSSKEVVDNSMPGTAMGFATSHEGSSGFNAAFEGTYSSMPSSGNLFYSSAGTYTIRYPKLNNNSQRNFPDGDFDAVALNYIRCKNHYVKGGQFAKNSAGKAWASHFFGPNLGNPGNLYPQFDCDHFFPTWKTPANIDVPSGSTIPYGWYPSSPPLVGSLKSWQWAFSRFWVRQDAGGFGADSGESSLGGQTFVTVEAARMAISSQLGSIGQGGSYCIANFGISPRPMKTVWSGNDNAPEEQRWISGVEFQRSAALITLFQLLQQPDAFKQAYDVSLLLNNPAETTNPVSTTNYTRYPTDPIIKGTLSDPTQSNFQDVMKHLYGMNRLLGSGSNQGDIASRHLANKGTFDVKQAIMDFRDMVTATGSRYDQFVNVIYFPSDMSGDATVTLTSTSKITTGLNVGKLSNENNLKRHLGIDPPTLLGDPQMIPNNIMDEVAPSGDSLNGKITYVLVVHKDTYDLFKERVKWLKTEMGKKDVKVIYKEVEGIYEQSGRRDYETFLGNELIPALENIKKTVTPGSAFNQMRKEQYSY